MSDTQDLRNTYPISTFRGTTQDELVEFIEGYANARVAAYHNDITDNERKVWLYSEDFQRRLLDARIDELERLWRDGVEHGIDNRLVELKSEKEKL